MTSFTGLLPPIVTPLLPDGGVDEASLRSLVEFQIAAGVDGLFILGSSGEAIYLDDASRRRVAEIAADAVRERVPLLVGALDSTPNRVIAQVRSFADLPVDAYVATAPFYANLAPAEIADHFRLVADAADAPVLAYDIPGNVGRRIDTRVLTALLADGTVAGLKDSSGSLTEFRLILDALGPDRAAAMLTGADILADLALALGADGLIPGLANVRPDLFVNLLTAHREGATGRVAVYQRAITRLTAIFGAGEPRLGRHASELGALKYFLQKRGVIEHTTVSLPLGAYSEDGRLALDTIARQVDDIVATLPVPA